MLNKLLLLTPKSSSVMENSFFFTTFRFCLKLNSAAFFCNFANLLSYLETFFRLGFTLRRAKLKKSWIKIVFQIQKCLQFPPEVVHRDVCLLDLLAAEREVAWLLQNESCANFLPGIAWCQLFFPGRIFRPLAPWFARNIACRQLAVGLKIVQSILKDLLMIKEGIITVGKSGKFTGLSTSFLHFLLLDFKRFFVLFYDFFPSMICQQNL